MASPHLAQLAVLTVALVTTSKAVAQARLLDLVPSGEPRAVPERILGLSAEPFWDNFIKDPAKVAAIRSLHPAYTRFPGGSQSNYYDWKRGLFFLDPGMNHSAYFERFVALSRFVARKYPEGISLEQYKAFSNGIGAAIIMVPNLETATVADQVSWFKHLAARSAVPTHIELGNEFWAAMGQDPEVLAPLAGRADVRAHHKTLSWGDQAASAARCKGRVAGDGSALPGRARPAQPRTRSFPPVERQPSPGSLVRCRDAPSLSTIEPGDRAGRSRGGDHPPDRPAQPAGPDGTDRRRHRP